MITSGQAIRTRFDSDGQGFPIVLRFATGAGVAVANGTNAFGRMFAPYAGKAVRWTAAAEVNGASGGWTFDILKNGVSILAAPVAVPVSTTALQSGTFSGASVAQDDAFTVNISGVGGTAPTGVAISLHLQTQNQ
jgi:hypothetical protein